MRILTHLRSLERLGGIEVSVLEAARALTARGHEVHVMYGPAVADRQAPSLREDLEDAGAVLHGPYPISTPTVREALPALRSYLPAAEAAARLAPDVVWLHRSEHIVWGQLVALRARVALVCHLHDSPAYARGRFPQLARGVRFLAVSDFIRREWISAGIRPDRVGVQLNAVPPGAYPPGDAAVRRAAREELGLPADAPVALFYGRLTEDKGVATVARAWEVLAAHRGQVHLLVAGDWDPGVPREVRTTFEQLVRRGAATVLPARRDVVPLLHAADLVIAPSSYAEPCGRVLLEAMQTGIPPLGSCVGGIPEVLSGPMSRFLVPPDDGAALAAAIARLALWRESEPGLRAECLSYVATHHSFGDYVTRIEEVLAEAAARGRVRAGGVPRRPRGGSWRSPVVTRR
jgi:glycosyltransferase involved in cell wall biosynthesis